MVELASADAGKTPVESLCSAADTLPPSFLAAVGQADGASAVQAAALPLLVVLGLRTTPAELLRPGWRSGPSSRPVLSLLLRRPSLLPGWPQSSSPHHGAQH
jgi:hypothetical protein